MNDPVCILGAGSRQELRIWNKPDSDRLNSEEVLSPCKCVEQLLPLAEAPRELYIRSSSGELDIG